MAARQDVTELQHSGDILENDCQLFQGRPNMAMPEKQALSASYGRLF